MDDNKNPFASEPAEKAYESLLKTGVKCTRDQFREALKTFTLEQELSRKKWAVPRATLSCGAVSLSP
jgi:hypothetical protein